MQTRTFRVVGTEYLRFVNESKSNRGDAIEGLLRVVRTATKFARPALRAKLSSIQLILRFQSDINLEELEAAMQNAISLSAKDIFFKTFINLPPTSVTWARARAYLAPASKISMVAIGIKG